MSFPHFRGAMFVSTHALTWPYARRVQGPAENWKFYILSFGLLTQIILDESGIFWSCGSFENILVMLGIQNYIALQNA